MQTKIGEKKSTLKTLAIALIRSKLTNAQEIFFSAPKSELKNLQRIDCKTFKIALKVPLHTNNLNTCNEINILPLDYNRQAQTSKVMIKTKFFSTSCTKEIDITANSFAKRGKNIKSITPIRSFANPILEQLNLETLEVSLPLYHTGLSQNQTLTSLTKNLINQYLLIS